MVGVMRRVGAWVVFGGLLALGPSPASAAGLDVRGWLDRPGVKLLAVELYATWCKPCMAAVPRWRELHERYRAEGLRLVVIATQDPEAGCTNPGWNPDDVICDDDGSLARALGAADRLPAAFLWSWQGNLLVKKGHVDEVESSIEAWMKQNPRVDVEAAPVAAEVGVTQAGLRDLVRAEVRKSGKLEVVATAEERAALDRIKATSMSGRFDEETQCEVGKELSANSLLSARITGTKRRRLHLSLLSADRGCLVASSVVGWNARNVAGSVAEGVVELMQKLRPQLEMPRRARRGTRRAPRSSERRALGETPEAWEPERRAKRTVVRFESNPPGAVVQADGQLLCQDTSKGCSRALPIGPLRVSMQKERYVSRTETVNVEEGAVVRWKLDPDFGWLDVSSTPPGLEVQIGGKAVGTTPLRGHELPPGRYDVLVRDDCHYDQGESIAIDRGDRAKVALALPRREGAIDVSAKDRAGNDLAAAVIVDGERLGETPDVFRVSVCARQLALQHPAAGTWEQALSVAAKETARIEAVLDVDPAKQAAAAVAAPPPEVETESPTMPRWAWFVLAGAAVGGGVALDVAPDSAQNGQWDVLDVVPLVLYAGAAVFTGVGIFQ